MLSKLAICLRSMQLYYHTAHNLVKGGLFFQDHSTLSDFYEQCETDYDAVIEMAIVKEGEHVADLKMQIKEIYSKLKDVPCCDVEHNKVFFNEGLKLEKGLCEHIETMKDSCTIDCETLIGDIAARSAVRQYLIGQRLK